MWRYFFHGQCLRSKRRKTTLGTLLWENGASHRLTMTRNRKRAWKNMWFFFRNFDLGKVGWFMGGKTPKNDLRYTSMGKRCVKFITFKINQNFGRRPTCIFMPSFDNWRWRDRATRRFSIKVYLRSFFVVLTLNLDRDTKNNVIFVILTCDFTNTRVLQYEIERVLVLYCWLLANFTVKFCVLVVHCWLWANLTGEFCVLFPYCWLLANFTDIR